MRTFVLDKGRSSRFWNIDLQDNRCVASSGALHRAGKTRTHEYADARRARAAHDRLIREKLARGYVETTPPAVPPLQRALEEALVADPEDLAAHMAYADFLSDQGNPRGELIQAHLALEQLPRHSPQRDALRRRYAALAVEHGRTLLGSLAPFVLERPSVYAEPFRFRLGWLDILYVDRLDVGLARALVRAPEARLLSTLRIDDIAYESPAEYQPGDDTPTEEEFPSLWVLFDSLDLPNLRWLEVRCHSLSRDEMEAILNWPRLPRLEHLGLRVQSLGTDACQAIRQSRILGRLKVLDLQRCGLTDLDAWALASPELEHLELLNVDDNLLSEEGLRDLRATGATVQGDPSPLFDPLENEVYEENLE
jgi:uncharacterized protein (TIGR02996 family)